MKYSFTLISPSGFMAETTGRCSTLADAQKKLLPWLDSLPDELDGVKVIDWSHITIHVDKE